MRRRSSSALVAVLREAREFLVDLPDDAFDWSSWTDATAAVAEIDTLISELLAGAGDLLTIAVLFAPTGPLQEASMGGRWSSEFLALAERADAALATAGYRR